MGQGSGLLGPRKTNITLVTGDVVVLVGSVHGPSEKELAEPQHGFNNEENKYKFHDM